MAALLWVKMVLFLGMCVVASYTDLKKSLIPNWLTLPGIGLGLILGFVSGGMGGVFDSVLGMMIAALVPLLLFRFNAMGGGDVKLFAASGALLGINFAIELQLLSFFAGALYGMFLWIKQGEFLKRIWGTFLFKKRKTEPTTIKFAPAILVGCVILVVARVVESL